MHDTVQQTCAYISTFWKERHQNCLNTCAAVVSPPPPPFPHTTPSLCCLQIHKPLAHSRALAHLHAGIEARYIHKASRASSLASPTASAVLLPAEWGPKHECCTIPVSPMKQLLLLEQETWHPIHSDTLGLVCVLESFSVLPLTHWLLWMHSTAKREAAQHRVA